jgi:hypothetical protein
MKYLKKIFENDLYNDVDELMDFCQTNLAYLLDEGFEISIDERFCKLKDGFYMISVEEPNTSRYNEKATFNWSEIKDSFIPFMFLLNKSYKLRDLGNQAIGKCVMISYNEFEEIYSLDQILSDKVNSNKSNKISSIRIMINSKTTI